MKRGAGLNHSTFGSTLDQLKVTPPTEEEQRKAALNVCAFAADADEAQEMLAMLGLLEG